MLMTYNKGKVEEEMGYNALLDADVSLHPQSSGDIAIDSALLQHFDWHVNSDMAVLSPPMCNQMHLSQLSALKNSDIKILLAARHSNRAVTACQEASLQ